LRSAFASTTGGVMTEEVGAVTGDLELLTRPSTAGNLDVLVRYAGAEDLYAVVGSPRPVPPGEHRAAHERILEHLTTPGAIEAGNERPRDLRDL
jgi:hypothetical protein